MTDTNQLPEPELGYIQTDKSNQPAFSARQMREAMGRATQAGVTDGIRPEDFTVDVVVKPMGGFAPVNTQGVRVTHNPTGISVTCDVARSQHTNRHQAFEKLRTILALHPDRVAAPMSEIDIEADDSLRFVQRVLESDAPKEDRQSARDMVVGLRKRVRKAHHGITTQAKKETP